MNNSLDDPKVLLRIDLLKLLGKTNRKLRRAGIPLVARLQTATQMSNEELLDVLRKSERRLGWRDDS